MHAAVATTSRRCTISAQVLLSGRNAKCRGYRRAGRTLIAILCLIVSELYVLPATSAHASTATDRVCVFASLGASSTTSGGTTLYNRQASVEHVCEGFGHDANFDWGPAIACAIMAGGMAAYGQYGKGPTAVKFENAAPFVSGPCDGASLATSGLTTENACGTLSDLLGSSPIPEVKAFATGSAIACSLAHPFATWIESKSEKRAADAITQNQQLCLRWETHHFPLNDSWDAVRCAADDTGYRSSAGSATGITHSSPVSPGGSSGGSTGVPSPGNPGAPGTGQPTPVASLPYGEYRVTAATGGVYWRSAADWNTPVAVQGAGFYPGTVLSVECFSLGQANVPGSANAMWERAHWVGGPGSGSGWINEHFINDGVAINQPSPSPSRAAVAGSRNLVRVASASG
jgi:hypothetical protein